MVPLYFAPMNYLSNHLYRHILLKNGADYAFAELVQMDRAEQEIRNRKLEIIEDDLPKTIFQIGVYSTQHVKDAVALVIKHVKNPVEININMGCPHSTMLKNKTCGGILHDQQLMYDLSKQLVDICVPLQIIPSVKIRIGLSPEEIQVEDYVRVLSKAGISKVYIHARPLRHSYAKPTMYEHLHGLKEKFPEVELIYNGNVDCFEAYQEVVENFSCDGVMVARAALANPLIYAQIKKKEKTYSGAFDPSVKDTSLVRINGFTYLSQKKADLIIQFVQLCEDRSIPLEYIIRNLKYLLKGISQKTLLQRLHEETLTFSDVKNSIQDMVYVERII